MKLAILHSRNFRLLLLSRMSVMMALQAQAVIIGWQIYSLTGDVFLLGMAGLVEAVPAILCALGAGYVVDNGDPKKVFLGCTGALALNTIGLFLVGGEIITGLPGGVVLWLFIGIFFSGLARGFVSPSAFTLMSQTVARNDMPAAAAWMSGGMQTAAVGGPAIAGLVYGGYGALAAWTIPAFLQCSACLLVAALKPPARAPKGAKREPAWQSIVAGWKYIWNNQVLLSMMALDMFAVLFGGAVAILPAVAAEILHVGSEGLGILRAAPAIGAIGTALFLALRPMRYVSAPRMMWAVAAFGLCMIGFGLSTTFWLSVVLLMLSGMFDSISMVTRGTLMQLLTPDHMKGRLSSINSMFIISSNEIGAFRSGVFARFMGLTPSIVVGGMITLGVVAATAYLAPRFRRTVVDAQESKA